MTFTYEPKGVCSSKFIITINEEKNTIEHIEIIDGCPRKYSWSMQTM